MKKCKKCNDIQEKKNFHKDNNNKDHLKNLCKKCESTQKKKYRQTQDGVITSMYKAQNNGSKKRNHPMPNYTKEELKQWVFNHPNWEELFNNWVLSNYNKDTKPSCDRLDDYKPYTFNNLQLITWKENRNKFSSDTINGINTKKCIAIIGTCIRTGKKSKFYSQSQAARELGCFQSNINKCLKGYIKNAYNHMWEYA